MFLPRLSGEMECLCNMEKFNTVIKVTKIGRVDNPVHPWNDFGESLPFHLGFFIKEPVVGERFNVGYINYKAQGISTSMVTKIINENTFETCNSIYKWEEQ